MSKSQEKEKSFNILEKEISVISAVNNPKLGPYLDIFSHYPENILLQPLGILTGFFRINDSSEESAYIVNFLSSLLKKEYYANQKRPIDSSFDSALQKVNLALSEIAKEGNINWLGKIEGAVCVLEKNNLHFSVCGKTKIMLLRNQILTEISKDLAPEEIEPNPLKTFVNVSSGRLEKGDKIIVCGDDVFDIFSVNELKKGASRFPREKFVQFVKTALTNKLEIIGTIVIDVFEKEAEEKNYPGVIEIETYNAFSKKTFENKAPKIENLKNILENSEKNDYTDGKTGHIYIQEEEQELKKDGNFSIYWFLFKEKISDAFYWTKNRTKRKFSVMVRSLAKSFADWKEKTKQKKEERERMKLLEKEKAKKEKQKLIMASTVFEEKTSEPEIFSATQPEQPVSPVEAQENPFLARLARRKAELEKLSQNEEIQEKETPAKKGSLASFKKIIPNFGKIKEIFSRLSGKQKIYTAAIILLIFVVPFVFLKVQTSLKNKKIVEKVEEKTPDTREILSAEKNIAFLSDPEKVFDIQEPKVLISLNEKIITAGNGKLMTLDSSGEKKEISWPQQYGNIDEASAMKDLNTAFLLTDQKKVVSFLSATYQFEENKISLPENSDIRGIGTYLTYAYFLDSKNNQIYRYPRATGGFGEKTNWLKDSLDLKDACCLSLDENVYFINGGKVLKLFKGQNQNLNLEQTANAYVPSKIFTNSDIQNIYVLDNQNGRIIKFAKDGSLVAQYFHESIKNSTDFVIDEKNNKAFLSNSQGITSFNLQ